MAVIQRVDVLGVGVSTINMQQAIDEFARWIAEGCREYVCITGVHGVMESQTDPELMAIHNASGLTTPDGMPMVWCGRRAGADWMDRVCGPELMVELARVSAERGWTWYLYGGADGVPELLADTLTAQFPALKIVGTYSPPFRPLTESEEHEIARTIDESGANIVWVGLSTPKQERWMARMRPLLREPAALVGVGAAFDIISGRVQRAPKWLRRTGFEWAYRMVLEPRRLVPRYFRANPAFVWRISRRRPTLYAPQEHRAA